MLLAAKTQALLDGREFVNPEDCASALVFVFCHRAELRSRGDLQFFGVDASILDDEWLTGVQCEAGALVRCPRDVMTRLILPSVRQPTPLSSAGA